MKIQTGLTVVAALALSLALASVIGAQQLPTPQPTQTPQATPTLLPTPMAFHCSCSTPGQPVVWAGRLTAPTLFAARQAAVGECLRMLGGKPISPLIATPQAGFAAGIPTPAPPMFNPCSNCACN